MNLNFRAINASVIDLTQYLTMRNFQPQPPTRSANQFSSPLHDFALETGFPVGLLAAFFLILVTFATQPGTAVASEGPISTGYFGDVAIGGHDTVAYHNPDAMERNEGTVGIKNWVHEWRGAKWRFASKENYERFKANPERYRPAYGGFCSNALTLGEGLIKTDGTHWEIFGDRLHLFFASRGRDRWLDGNYEKYNRLAARAWKEITGLDDH